MAKPNLSIRMHELRQRISAAEEACGRPKGAVQLLAVSKGQPLEALIGAYQRGQRQFAENYLQEALFKQKQLGHFDIDWHFIGPIQSNKCKLIAALFDWVHTVDRFKIAELLNEYRPIGLPPLNVCIQVNVSGESSKSGISPVELPGFVEEFSKWPRLRLRGLMAIPEPTKDKEKQRVNLSCLKNLKDQVKPCGMDTLSMGMSDDLEAAIEEGSNMVRIGTAFFGERNGRLN